jgi:NTP pyrophosphatase (non-canonical NTP hydrolase)
MMTVQQYYLLKLAEECSEVSQRALKQAQFGKKEKQSESPSLTKIETTSAQRLRDEVNDLLAVIDCLIDIGELSEITEWELIQEKGKKKMKLLTYLRYSRELGKVERTTIWSSPIPCCDRDEAGAHLRGCSNYKEKT